MSGERARQAELADLGLELEGPRCECGVFGVYAPSVDVSREAYLALRTLQHRGHESAGIAVNDNGVIARHSAQGLVDQVFSPSILDALQGEFAIGHNRYSTAGGAEVENEHPFRATGPLGELAIAHNGNLTNPERLAAELRTVGVEPNGTTDSELAALWIAHGGGTSWEENIRRFMATARGAYSMAVLTERSLYAFRDPHGVRPLQIGRTDEAWAVSSETLTFRTLGYRPYRAVAPGELVRIDAEGFRTIFHEPAEREALCVFEYIYFSRPDSELDGQYVNQVRRELGRELAREAPVDADIVSPVPQSGNPFAEGFAEELGLPHQLGFARNSYVGRSFIDPGDRRRIVEMKLNPMVDVVRGKRVCLVDDSIVRGNTMPIIVDMLWDAGATEVHVRIGSPPLVDTCHLGVDIPTREELIANGRSVEQIREELKAHSLAYLSEEGMYKAVRRQADTVCAACMTGQRPFPGAAPQSPHTH